MKMVSAAMVRLAMCFVLCQPGIAEDKEFRDLRFNADERRFLAYMAEHNNTLDHLVILLGLAEIAATPKTPADLIQALLQERITVKAPAWSEAHRGARRMLAGRAAQDVQWFLLGKHTDFAGQKPQGINRSFFLALLNHYVAASSK